MPWVYVLRCADHTLYVGSTLDLASRLVKHDDGSGSQFTARRRPVKLVHQQEFDSITQAKARERQLKRWTRAKKEALIGGDLALLKRL